MNLDERIKLIETYKSECRTNVPYGYGYNEDELLSTCKKLKALGLEWGDKISFDDFRITKGVKITNSATGYEYDSKSYYVHWDNGNIGAYQFVSGGDMYRAIQDEYKEFKEKLMSYNPIDWDDFNSHIVFDVENGKKVMADYEEIVKETREKIQIKSKIYKAEQAKLEYEKALAALD